MLTSSTHTIKAKKNSDSKIIDNIDDQRMHELFLYLRIGIVDQLKLKLIETGPIKCGNYRKTILGPAPRKSTQTNSN